LHNILETIGSNTEQANPRQNGKDMKETPIIFLQINKETTKLLKGKTSQTRDATMMEGTFHSRGTSQQQYNLCPSQTKKKKA
jgi:hypothetical protein